MGTLAESILVGKNCLNQRLKYCCVSMRTQIIQVIKDFLPYAKIAIDEESDLAMIVSIDFTDFKIRYKFTFEKKECGLYIRNIEVA